MAVGIGPLTPMGGVGIHETRFVCTKDVWAQTKVCLLALLMSIVTCYRGAWEAGLQNV